MGARVIAFPQVQPRVGAPRVLADASTVSLADYRVVRVAGAALAFGSKRLQLSPHAAWELAETLHWMHFVGGRNQRTLARAAGLELEGNGRRIRLVGFGRELRSREVLALIRDLHRTAE